ncbi:MAG: hypothetical protein KIT09_29195 [Bryobacteraceae bacterium]|nr:hypothetical protein [Bryobacteraceae bacterium]
MKTYGADGNRFGHTDKDGVERFIRHILAGFASARFHRPDSGLGLNRKAEGVIRAVRKVESAVRLWELSPADGLLTDRENNEAYAALKPGSAYVAYLTDGGAVGVKSGAGGFVARWIDVSTGEWGPKAELRTDSAIQLTAPGRGNWLAVVLKQ